MLSTTTALSSALRLYWPVDALCCVGGLRNILYAFGLGYGLSMMSNGALAVGPHLRTLLARAPKSDAAMLPLVGAGLYVAYGARLAGFLLRRQSHASYGSKLADVQAKSTKMPLAARGSVTIFVSASQALYSIPLQLACQSALASQATVPLLGWAALSVSASGLLLETVADEQKMAAKAAAPCAPCTHGLYTRCRHPNYLGEILFHLGMWGLVSPCPVRLQLVGLISPLFMCWVMVGAAKRLDAEGAKKYADNAGYRAWVERTGALLPAM